MSTSTRPLAHYLAPVLLGLGALLTVAHWYVEPARMTATTAAAILYGVMTVAWLFAVRYAGDAKAATRQAADAIASAISFAGLLMAIALGARMGITLGLVDDAESARRVQMAMLGAFFMFTGNAMPKTLTPLSSLAGAGRTQAFQRFAGWNWTLAGLTYAIVWLTLPLEFARPVSMLVIVGAMATIVARIVKCWWMGQRPA